jgi:hypothetical protein
MASIAKYPKRNVQLRHGARISVTTGRHRPGR